MAGVGLNICKELTCVSCWRPFRWSRHNRHFHSVWTYSPRVEGYNLCWLICVCHRWLELTRLHI
jgi:hypothetical protein